MPLRSLTAIEMERHKVLMSEVGDVGLLMPTETGLKKSILDATLSIRALLKLNGLHDYGTQPQGDDGKTYLQTVFLSEDKLIGSRTSLYRPHTKKGDPRIWFRGLPAFADKNNILALFLDGNTLVLVNLTKTDIKAVLARGMATEMGRYLERLSRVTHAVSDELLGRLRDIARQPVLAVCAGDTAVGRTLETLLGIRQNSSKTPDYKGIELKSYRGGSVTRSTLFAQVPNWKRSKVGSTGELLDVFGYPGERHERQLNCTVSALRHNTQGLRLSLDLEADILAEVSNRKGYGKVAVWDLPLLHDRLLTKHRETFWVAAKSTRRAGLEEFRFEAVRHTANPSVAQFDELIGSGGITVDHLISRDIGKHPVEKGPLFKVAKNKANLLFPEPRLYSLI
jgi:hypothetical protein